MSDEIEAEDVDTGADVAVDDGDVGVSDVDSGAGDGYSQEPEAAAPTQAEIDYMEHFARLPQFQGQDRRAIAGSLYQSLQQAQSAQRALTEYQRVIPYAQRYLQHQAQFEKWMGEQEAAAKAAQAPPKQQPLWNPPEVREAYKRYLVKDESGREVIDPNAPPDAANALYERQQYIANFATNLVQDPENTLRPFIDRIATERAEQLFNDRMADVSLKGYVANLEQENADWLLQEDGVTPTPQGAAVQQYIQQAQQIGINDARAAFDYATQMVELQMSRQALAAMQQQLAGRQAPPMQQAPMQRAPAPRPAPAAPQRTADPRMEFLRREAARNPSRSPAPEAGAPQAAPQSKGASLFTELMRRQAEADGLLSST